MTQRAKEAPRESGRSSDDGMSTEEMRRNTGNPPSWGGNDPTQAPRGHSSEEPSNDRFLSERPIADLDGRIETPFEPCTTSNNPIGPSEIRQQFVGTAETDPLTGETKICTGNKTGLQLLVRLDLETETNV
jgi:hypothetical protein